MKTYWDSSALVEAVFNPVMKQRLETERAYTRPHALAETFSTLTGNPETRISADNAAAVIQNLSRSIDYVEVSASEVLAALKKARSKGVRGGRVHDYLHAIAAEKAGAGKILTCDKHDFDDLTEIKVEQF